MINLLVAIFIFVYVAVALVNFTLVQSAIGSVASSYFTEQWGGKVKIGSMGFNPFNHVKLRNIELISPTNDTICTAHTIALRFNKFPFDKHGLSFSRVLLRDVRYHLQIDTNGINLKYIIDSFKSDKEKEPRTEKPEFKIVVDNLRLDGVTYIQDLNKKKGAVYDGVGVDIPHMAWYDVNARFRNVRVDATGGPHITCRIDRFSTTEKSGLRVRQLMGNAYVTSSGIGITDWLLETDNSHFEGDVMMDFNRFKSMGSFFDSVFFTVHFNQGCYGGMQDAAYWAHKLWGMNEKVYLQGDFAGPLGDFYAEDVKIAFGEKSRISLDANICGLPKIHNTVISGHLHRLYTTYGDLASVNHPNGITLKAENILKTLDYLDLEATFEGTISDFSASLQGDTRLGDIAASVKMSIEKGKPMRYAGKLSSTGFAIGDVAPNEWVSRSGFDMEFEGRGLDLATMKAAASGNLHHVTLRGQRLVGEAAVDLNVADSVVTAEMILDDAIASISAHAEMRQRAVGRLYTASLDAEHVDIKRLRLWNDTADVSAKVDAHLHGRYSQGAEGNSLARITVDDIHLKTSTKDYSTGDMTVSMREHSHWKDLTINSRVLTAQLRGYYEFQSMTQIVGKFVDDFMPANLLMGRSLLRDDGYESIADAQFELDVEWHDQTGLLQAFVPRLMVAQGTTVQANYNFVESMKPLIRSDSLYWGDIKLYNVGANGEAVADQYRMRVTSDEFFLGKVKMSENADVSLSMSNSGALCRMYWENSSQTVGGGDVNLRLVADSSRTRLVVDPSELALGGVQWHLFDSQGESYFADGLYFIDGLALVSDSQSLSFKASRLDKSDDAVQLVLHNFGLALFNSVLESKNMSVGGIADGEVNLGGLNAVPYLNADLKIKQLAFDDEPLGDARIRSTWNGEMNQLNMHLSTDRLIPSEGGGHYDEPLSLVGYVTLGNADGEIDMSVSLSDVSMKIIQPFVTSFSSQVDGYASGQLDIAGTIKQPVVDGYLSVKDGLLMVDFVNVAYTFSDTINVESSTVRLHDFNIGDSHGGYATINGTIGIEEQKGLVMDLQLKSDKLLCMNTASQYSNNQAIKQSSAFYGTIVASANGTVKGTASDIDVIINARTLPGSTLSVPMNDKKQVKNAEYITFVNDNDYALEENTHYATPHGSAVNGESTLSDPQLHSHATSEDKMPHGSNYNLVINIAATPDMEMMIPLTTPTLEADIKARGTGDLQMQLGSDRQFALIGDYELNSGTVGMRLLGIRNWDFTIEDGGVVNFPGAIMDASFSVNAIYSQRVNMSSLTGTLSSTESQKQIVVQNVIAFTGTIKNPDISFDIRLPNADQSVQEEVFAYIDRGNERDMLNQTVSLLLLGRFYNSSVSSDAAATSVADEGYGLVANSLGAVVSNMVQIVDVNFDYKAGNALTTDQVAVDISKEWNKFYFETSLGFGGEAKEINSVGATNTMTGDMLVGYKINPRLHFFVFNRSNTNDYTRSDLPYKQGVGIKYTRDFDNWKDLFKRKKKNGKAGK